MAVVSKAKLVSLGNDLVKGVESMYREEVFGVKGCDGVKWECLFNLYLVIEAFESYDGTTYTQEDIDCMYGSVNK